MSRVKVFRPNKLFYLFSPACLPFEMRHSKRGFFVGKKIKFMGFRYIAALAIFVAVFVAISCRGTVSQTDEPAEKAMVRDVRDDLGRSIKLPIKIERAISLAPNLTEIVFAVGGGEQLVGVTTYCNYPEQAKSISSIGDTMNPNIERIIALKPQVVFVSTASQIEVFTKRLEEQGIQVYVTNPTDLDGVYKSITAIGGILGKEENAEKVVGDMRKRVSDVEAKIKEAEKPKVFVQISKEPLYTIGSSSFMNNLVLLAGGISVTEKVTEAYPKFSKESALAAEPDVIILSDSEDNREPNDAFKNSPAVRNGKVFHISADLISRPGPRMVDALEQAAKALHPERFN